MKGEQGFLIGIVFLAILALLASFTMNAPLVFAENTTNQTNITVNVLPFTEITVIPRNLTWYTQITPGSTGGRKQLEIKNSGSNTITKVYAYVDTLDVESSNPIPQGDPTKYASGGVLMIKKNDTPYDPTAVYDWYHVGRLEWNTSLITLGSPGPAGASTTGGDIPITWGYYRNATPGYNYLFYLVNGSEINDTGGCNTTGSKIMIETDVDTGELTTRNPALGDVVSASVPDWGIYNFTSGPLVGSCVAIYRTCEKIYIYRYDRRNTGFTQFNECLLDDDEQSLRTTNFAPGEEFQIDLDAWIPEGIAGGWLASDWLTLEAYGIL